MAEHEGLSFGFARRTRVHPWRRRRVPGCFGWRSPGTWLGEAWIAAAALVERRAGDTDLSRGLRRRHPGPQKFLDNRRRLRPAGEYRTPTRTEWGEFEEHFDTRKVELLFNRADMREPFTEAFYMPGGEAGSLTLGVVPCVQRAGDHLLTRPVLLSHDVLDDAYHRLPAEAWGPSSDQGRPLPVTVGAMERRPTAL
ncbi:hypothetical protein [Streptomyces sp. NPDC091371]|uniref:hypothetical protein n=1 Tax=Streptomyces sp. NPDC091371 TaxID=3155303 RepID=UPI0034344807